MFSGIWKFSEFLKKLFINLIAVYETLTKEQKLFYLRRSIHSEAKLKEASEDILLNNYLMLLKNDLKIHELQFALILRQYKKLNNYISNHLKFWEIADIINKSLRALKVFWLKWEDLSNSILVNTLLEKLNKETRKAYALLLTSKETSLKNLIGLCN